VRTFSIIWSGQLASTIGTYMTEFALTLWVWKITGSATALSLIVFFSQLPRILISLFAGAIVDRCDRKQLMMVGDAIAALCTIARHAQKSQNGHIRVTTKCSHVRDFPKCWKVLSTTETGFMQT
jgi:Transmembrane secretion effector